MILNYQQTIHKNYLKCARFVQSPTHLLVIALSGYALALLYYLSFMLWKWNNVREALHSYTGKRYKTASVHDIKTYTGGAQVNSTLSETQRQTHASGHLHAKVALPHTERSLVPIEYEAWWTPELLWAIWRREKPLNPAGNWTPIIQLVD